MHPVNYLFEDIYRNDGASGRRQQVQRRGRTGPWIDLRFLMEWKRS